LLAACILDRLRSLDAERWHDIPSVSRWSAKSQDFLGLDAGQVLLTNGVDEAIHLLCATYLEPGDEAIIVVPTFAMYAIFAQAEGARVIPVFSGEGSAFPLDDLLSRISLRTRLIAMANPNNPTGAAVPCEVLLQVARAAPRAAVSGGRSLF
jgi:histidinol-phosphate aminotransferase